MIAYIIYSIGNILINGNAERNFSWPSWITWIFGYPCIKDHLEQVQNHIASFEFFDCRIIFRDNEQVVVASNNCLINIGFHLIHSKTQEFIGLIYTRGICFQNATEINTDSCFMFHIFFLDYNMRKLFSFFIDILFNVNKL